MFIEGTKEFLEEWTSRVVETGDGPVFYVTLQNWHWEVFRFCEENGRFKTNDWHIRGAWEEAQDAFAANGTPLWETFSTAMAYAALLAAESELDEIDGHANSMRPPNWPDMVIRRSTNGVME